MFLNLRDIFFIVLRFKKKDAGAENCRARWIGRLRVNSTFLSHFHQSFHFELYFIFTKNQLKNRNFFSWLKKPGSCISGRFSENPFFQLSSNLRPKGISQFWENVNLKWQLKFQWKLFFEEFLGDRALKPIETPRDILIFALLYYCRNTVCLTKNVKTSHFLG